MVLWMHTPVKKQKKTTRFLLKMFKIEYKKHSCILCIITKSVSCIKRFERTEKLVLENRINWSKIWESLNLNLKIFIDSRVLMFAWKTFLVLRMFLFLLNFSFYYPILLTYLLIYTLFVVQLKVFKEVSNFLLLHK